MDDIAGQAYIEQFGMETFQRADNAVRANRASRYYTELSRVESCLELKFTQANRGHFPSSRDILRFSPHLGST